MAGPEIWDKKQEPLMYEFNLGVVQRLTIIAQTPVQRV